MIQGLGIDITEIERVWQASLRTKGFIQRVLTPAEITVYNQYTGQRQKEFLAGRFSAKEAFSKAMGTGIGKVKFQDLTVLNDEQGQPYIEQQLYSGKVLISISHTDDYVLTEVILEKRAD
ncbi:holo-ACP synthase [Bombilactobacillus bombi]|uniref:Holo-[acyl-carrier-protein] synthase n=1 Tax=Bombilactobacillus bombi TaxID=1303590 RepID=A0A3R6YJR8_9LACO|nr:holo-ACP synthase [Bombilactobacillus bombi]RHW47763.1 holo-ACP synthase [Bombilactobacillus bombi]